MVQFGVVTFNRGPYSSAENLAKFGQRAEELGYNFIAVNDHVVIPHNDPRGHGDKSVAATINYFDPLMTMMYLGGLTRRIRIGTSVLILPYRPPLPTAKALASLDTLLGGRLFLGVGVGWWQEEFDALGIGDQFAERGDRTDETLRIFKTVWRDLHPEFEGRYHAFRDIEFSPLPMQAGGPPIWVGGNKGRALRRMAEFGDVWHPLVRSREENGSAESFGANRDKVAFHFEKAGRDPATLGVALRATVRVAAPGSDPKNAFMGPPAHLVETVQAYKARGLTQLAVYFAGEMDGTPFSRVMEQMQQIAEDVIPHCR